MFPSVVTDVFDVGGVIGKGLHKVHSATRKSDSKVFAIKVVSFAGMGDGAKKQVVREVNLQRAVRSPHVVRYVDRIVCKESQTLYIVLEHCSGGSLGDLIRNHRKRGCAISGPAVLRVAEQMARALCVVHEGGEGETPIVHRDVKPENIFLDGDGNAKLGDFGLARELPEGDTRGATGTPRYMSPEAIGEYAYGTKTDIWALGCTLYKMVTLRYPFDAESRLSMAAQICAGRRQPLPHRCSEVVKRLVDACLCVEAKGRPSAQGIVDGYFAKK